MLLSEVTSQSGTFPQIAIAGNGNVYVGWEDSVGEIFDIFIKSSLDSGKNFSSAVNISQNPGDSGNLNMKTLGDEIDMVWQNSVPSINLPATMFPEVSEIFFRSSKDRGKNFDGQVIVSATKYTLANL